MTATPRRAPRELRVPTNAPPPGLRIPLFEKLKIQGTQATELIIVSSQLSSCDTHYVDGRTQLCTEALGECWLQPHDSFGRRWYGWLAVIVPGNMKIRLTWVTKVAVKHEPRLLDRTRSLRGLRLTLQREHKGIGANMWAGIKSRQIPETNLPPEPDMDEVVHRMYLAKDRDHRVEARGVWQEHYKNATELADGSRIAAGKMPEMTDEQGRKFLQSIIDRTKNQSIDEGRDS